MIVPWAKWRPVPSHSGPLTKHLGLVFHSQEGNGSLFEYFSNPANGVSSTGWIAKDGTAEQYVDTDLECWAQKQGNAYYNAWEFEGFHTEPLTEPQIATGAKISAWTHAAHFCPLELVDHGGAGITTHAHYPSGAPDPAWGGHPCPGTIRSEQMPAIVAAARKLLVVVDPPDPKGSEMLCYFVHTAGGWYQVFASGMVVPLPDAVDGSSLTNPVAALGPVVPGAVDDAYIQNLIKAWASRGTVTAAS